MEGRLTYLSGSLQFVWKKTCEGIKLSRCERIAVSCDLAASICTRMELDREGTAKLEASSLGQYYESACNVTQGMSILDASSISAPGEEDNTVREVRVSNDAVRTALTHCQFLLSNTTHADTVEEVGRNSKKGPQRLEVLSCPGESWSIATELKQHLSGLRISLARRLRAVERQISEDTMSLCIASEAARTEVDWLTNSAHSASPFCPTWILPGLCIPRTRENCS